MLIFLMRTCSDTTC